jgi:DNA-directed RNA polymerase subunit delta
MRRIIVDYSKLTKEILDLLVAKYPEGYNAMDIISFRDMHKNLIDAVQVETEDTVYLVKVSKKLATSMEEHDVDADFGPEDNYEEDDLIFREDPEIGEEPDFDE